MSKTIKVRTSYTGCPYITAGKVYEATIKGGFKPKLGLLIAVMGDHGGDVVTNELASSHIGYQDWEILPEGPSIADELAEALQNLKAAIGKTPVDISKPGWGAVVAELCEADVVLAKYKESKQ